MATLTPYYPRQIANPDFGSIADGEQFVTRKSRTRDGHGLSLSESTRALRFWALTWSMISRTDWEILRTFFEARYGAAGQFYMPSLLEDTALASDYGGSTTLAIPSGDESLFSGTDYAYGNYFVIYDPSNGHVACQAVASTSAGQLTIDASIGASGYFTAGSIIERAVPAWFNDDRWAPGLFADYRARLTLGVEEVRVGW